MAQRLQRENRKEQRERNVETLSQEMESTKQYENDSRQSPEGSTFWVVAKDNWGWDTKDWNGLQIPKI